MILQALHFNTKVGFAYYDNNINGEETIEGTDEITAAYFETADKNLPVLVRKIASYHDVAK
ncbi:hypothetical protein FPZ43_00070 [Mucilaginibacter pallidiroseus]|uniref:Uncharacterized protein n=1 Tax=Mucilaginibacter pallidiroseus TaxID=2599295 RepID=A0A563UHQ7_9SPHI|nr:hypothetical protein [Mucilaginibacter pallidiroseus]TWR30914.1 hypothetical protein FPZ43_00070 [Mucilaginibacter pallidiroseus]